MSWHKDDYLNAVINVLSGLIKHIKDNPKISIAVGAFICGLMVAQMFFARDVVRFPW